MGDALDTRRTPPPDRSDTHKCAPSLYLAPDPERAICAQRASFGVPCAALLWRDIIWSKYSP